MSTRVSDNKRIPNERQTPKGFNALWETIIGCDRWNPHPSLVRGFQLNLCGMHYMPCNHLLGHRTDNICGGGARRELCLRSGLFRSCKQYQVPSPSPSLSLSSCHGLVHRLNYWQQQKQQHELNLELIFFLLLSLSLSIFRRPADEEEGTDTRDTKCILCNFLWVTTTKSTIIMYL